MKNIISVLIFIVCASAGFAQSPYNYQIRSVNAAGTNFDNWYLGNVQSGTDYIFMHNGASAQPALVGIGFGLLYSGGSLAVDVATFATVAYSGAYADLSGKPTLATVATTGAYSDLTGKPTVPTVLTATGTLDFPNIAAGSGSTLTISLTGAAVGDSVMLGLPSAPDVSASYQAYVSATDTITVRFFNLNLLASLNPASATFRATIVK